MFKYALSVRAYNRGRKFGLPYFENWSRSARFMPEFCRYAGMENWNAKGGLKTSVELLRAGGAGVYTIYRLLNRPAPLDRIREMCAHFDRTLHEPLD